MNRIFIACLCVFGLIACKKDRPEESVLISQISQDGGVYVGSEGNFQFGNASLSYYDKSTKEIRSEVYESANGFKVGDV